MDTVSREDEFQEIVVLASRKYIDELNDASRYLISQYGGKIKQFTIDFLDWHYDEYEDVSKDLPGSLLYKWENLKQVFNQNLQPDFECLETITSIVKRWHGDIEQRWKIFNEQ